jgi:hypothetical protein
MICSLGTAIQRNARLTAHWLYHQARTLMLEADREAMAENEAKSE